MRVTVLTVLTFLNVLDVLTAQTADPRVGLRAGRANAGVAASNLRLVSNTPLPEAFVNRANLGDFGRMNSDLAFQGTRVFQGNFYGIQIWDIANPAQVRPILAMVCPGAQNDVSVYRNLLFVSSEDPGARRDCGAGGLHEPVSPERVLGIRIFDISDIANPRQITQVQTCRGSHTHTLVTDPRDTSNVYIYVSGSGGIRSPQELPGCVEAPTDPNTAHFRIEVIRVPVANPAQAAIVSSPRIFEGLTRPAAHGEAPEDVAAAAREAAEARSRGLYTVRIQGLEVVLPPQFSAMLLDSTMRARGGTGTPTAADSTALRNGLQAMVDAMVSGPPEMANRGPSQCHDITVYVAIRRAGGACGGYGLLLDISDPVNPRRIAAAADSNFAYWHSATFNNDGSKILFTDEWGGGTAAKCRATDRPEWGANAYFTIERDSLRFRGYSKLPAAQTAQENCVAHNGSLIPVPGRDIFVQGWYQGGISVVDWTDPARPVEIAYFDRGPLDSAELQPGGSWSAYWYNGHIISSEIARGLDILELLPSNLLSQNEIDAAKSVVVGELNAQNQQRIVWPATFAVPKAYVDQLLRSGGLSAQRVEFVRMALQGAESQQIATRRQMALNTLASQLQRDVNGSSDQARVRALIASVRELAAAAR